MVGNEPERRMYFVCNSSCYLLFPVFEVGFFFFPLFFFLDTALFLLPIDVALSRPSTLAEALVAALRLVTFVGVEVLVLGLEAFIFEEAPRVGWGPL